MIQVYFPKEGRKTLTPIIFKEENLKVRRLGFRVNGDGFFVEIVDSGAAGHFALINISNACGWDSSADVTVTKPVLFLDTS